jgi:aspartate aminotransferase-like enzyme
LPGGDAVCYGREVEQSNARRKKEPLMKKYYLMAPGPTPVPSNVLLAMAQPLLHHRTPEYEALFLEVRAGLKRLFQTSRDVVRSRVGTGAWRRLW